MAAELIDHIHSWVEQWMDNRGGGNNWDWNHSNSIFSSYYDRYGVDIETSMSDYNISQSKVEKQNVYETHYGPNDYDSTFHFSHTDTESDSFTWTLSDTIKQGVSGKVGVDLPKLFSAEVGMSFEISTTMTQSQTKTNTSTWTQKGDIPVPANQEATVTMVVSRAEAEGSITLDAVAKGRVAAGLNNRWQGHYFWFIPVASLAREFNESSAVSVHGDEVHFSVPVSFDGAGAVSSHIRVTGKDDGDDAVGEYTTNHIDHPAQLLVGADPEE